MKNHRKAAKGTFANAYKGPPNKTEQGLDWSKLRAQNHERLAQDAANGSNSPDARLWRENKLGDMTPQERDEFFTAHALRKVGATIPKMNLTRADKARGGSSRAPRIDVPEVVRLYVEEKMKPEDVAKKMGIAVETVRRHLKIRGVFEPRRHLQGWQGPVENMSSSKPRLEKCDRGHDLTVPGNSRQNFKVGPRGGVTKNGRECLVCRRDRDREWQRGHR